MGILNAGDPKISEKEAVKNRKSIKVSRNGDKVTADIEIEQFQISSPKEEGSFTIFLREQFWLESRRIVHRDGSPWSPSKDVSSIDLTADAESEANNAPPKKKAKRENGLSGKIKDCIDLTKS